MARYHVNPKTGEPGQCKAQQACPFGGESEHYDSPEEARTAFEASVGVEYLQGLAKEPIEQATLEGDYLTDEAMDELDTYYADHGYVSDTVWEKEGPFEPSEGEPPF